MIMNDAPECVENAPRFKLNEIVYIYIEYTGIIKGNIITIAPYEHRTLYDIKSKKNGEKYIMPESQIFPDFNSCKIAVHATYLQKIKELLEQKDD